MIETINLIETPLPRDSGNKIVPGATIVETPNHQHIARIQSLPAKNPGESRLRLPFSYLSPSQIKTYNRCQASYLFKYHYKMREPMSSAMLFGLALHVASETYFKAAEKFSDMNQEQRKVLALDQALLYIRMNIPEDIKWKQQWKNGPAETLESIIESMTKAVTTMVDDVWKDLKPVFVEQGFLLEWKDPDVLPVLGYLDMLIPHEDGHELVDLKTGVQKKDLDNRLDIALPFYAETLQIYTAVPTKKITYHSYVRNKTPKFVTISNDYEIERIARLYRISKNMTKVIATMSYQPKDESSVCNGCSFYDRCQNTEFI